MKAKPKENTRNDKFGTIDLETAVTIRFFCYGNCGMLGCNCSNGIYI